MSDQLITTNNELNNNRIIDDGPNNELNNNGIIDDGPNNELNNKIIINELNINSRMYMSLCSSWSFIGLILNIMSLSTCHPAKDNSFTCLSGSTHSMSAISYSYDVCDNYCAYVNFVSGSSKCALYIGSFGSNATAIDEAHSYSIGKYYDLMYTDNNTCYEPTTYFNILPVLSILCLTVALMCLGRACFIAKQSIAKQSVV